MTVAVFLLTYVALALGRVPGLAIDRAGIALVGAAAMLACSAVGTADLGVAIDAATIVLLFGLRVLSAQLQLAGFYARVADAITRASAAPAWFLLRVMLASAGLSAVLINDVVCLAFTPILCDAARRSGLNPLPLLLGLAAASNLGSAATIIGNPQNILIGQTGRLDFAAFAAWCVVPSLVALLAAWGILLWLFAGRLRAPAAGDGAPPIPLDRLQSGKGIVLALILVGSFFTQVPREVSALGVAAVVLLGRRYPTSQLLAGVDWSLLALFCGLFVVGFGLRQTDAPAAALAWARERGVGLQDPYALAGIAAVLSNLVSNVPATMLLLPYLDGAEPRTWYVLALASTYAGNLVTIGSIANLIVLEQGRGAGVEVGFAEHARAGVPITLASFAILAAWIALA